MADEMEDTPPPLPATLPPSLESSYAGRKRSSSKKFLMLQEQLSSAKTMYSGGAPKPAPPPVRPKPLVKLKRSNAIHEDEVNNNNDALSKKSSNFEQKLVHRTLERPKRKGIRTPSRGSLHGTSSSSVTSVNKPSPLLPTTAPSDFDLPPPLPTSAPPPNTGDASEILLPSDIVDSVTSTNDDVFAPDSSGSPRVSEPTGNSESPPSLPMNKSPITTAQNALHEPPSLKESQPIETLPSDKPPPSSESLSVSKSPSRTLLSYNNLTEPSPLFNIPIPTNIPSPLNGMVPTSRDQPVSLKDTSLLYNPPESPPHDAPPPPPPLSLPPKEHEPQKMDNIINKSGHIESHLPTTLSNDLLHKEKEQVTLTDSFGSSSSAYAVSSSSGFSSVKEQEKSPSPLMTSSHSVWSSTSPTLESNNQSFSDKSDYSLNSSNTSITRGYTTNYNASAAAVTDAKPPIDNKHSSNVSKFRERIARLKQKREAMMPSPAMSVQSEVVTLNSRVTSPLQSSYSATLLDSSDIINLSKPRGGYTTSISPPMISSEELWSPPQFSPVSYPTTNFLHFANNPPTVSSDVKRVEPFTVKKISSNRVSSSSLTPVAQSPPDSNSMGTKITTVDSHLESAFSKPWSSLATDNTEILSGLPSDTPVSSSTDVNHSDDEGDVTPPPLPSSLPPDAFDTFESDGYFAQANVIYDDVPPPDLPSIPPPTLPTIKDSLEDETLINGPPPLPTSPIPFEASSTEQPFTKLSSIGSPKNSSQTPDSPHISVPTEFAPAKTECNKVKTVPDQKTGDRSPLKTNRPISYHTTREPGSLSQTPASTGSSRHSIHLQYDLELEKDKTDNLPMYVCQHLVTQQQDDKVSDGKTQKSSKKSSKLKFPWQRRLTHDRSHSMSDERLKKKKKSSKEGFEIRHSSADIKQDVNDSMLRDKAINRLKVTNGPVTSASVGDLRRPQATKRNIDSLSASHTELSKGSLPPSPPQLAVTASSSVSSVAKPPRDEPDVTSVSKQQSLKIVNALNESNISLPHMTTPELYRKLTQPSDPSLFESVMKDISLFNTNSAATEEIIEQPLVENQSKEKTSLSNQQELPATPETFTDKHAETDQSTVVSSQECLDSSQSDSPHDITMDSYGSPPSPVSSVRSDQGWSSSAVGTPNLHDRRWKELALGSINTLTSNDSLRDLAKRVTIGDWNVDHVINWLESVGLSSVVPVFQQFSINGAELKMLNHAKLSK